MAIDTISITGRNTQGVKLMRLDEDGVVSTVAMVEREEEDEELQENELEDQSQETTAEEVIEEAIEEAPEDSEPDQDE